MSEMNADLKDVHQGVYNFMTGPAPGRQGAQPTENLTPFEQKVRAGEIKTYDQVEDQYRARPKENQSAL